jgi:hypothetical protein
MAITLSNFTSFITSLESSIKNDIPSFQGFGSSLSADIGSITVDVEKVFNWGLTAFSISGNAEAGVLAPIATIAEGVVNSIESALGITTTGSPPASVTAAAAAIVAGTSSAIPVVPGGPSPAAPAPAPAPAPVPGAGPQPASSFSTGDGTKVGDDPDAGAIGG